MYRLWNALHHLYAMQSRIEIVCTSQQTTSKGWEESRAAGNLFISQLLAVKKKKDRTAAAHRIKNNISF